MQEKKQAGTTLKSFLVAIPVAVVAVQWLLSKSVVPGLQSEVFQVARLSWLETPYAYLYLHIFTFVPIFLLSFDKNVHYYTRWRYLLPAITLVAAFFIGWDALFTARGVWGFNDTYVLGIHFADLPLEEWLFFFIVPFACVFIYECLNFYVKKDWLGPYDKQITIGLAIILLLVGGWYWQQLYTVSACLLSAALLLYHLFFLPVTWRGRFYLAYAVSLIPFLLVNGVLTGGYTQQPVVLYNPEEMIGFRLTSVPVEDSAYGFLMIFGVVTLYERFRGDRRRAHE
jgi:lycopene cyclase domain-containing protein